jgi:hypothetical protein
MVCLLQWRLAMAKAQPASQRACSVATTVRTADCIAAQVSVRFAAAMPLPPAPRSACSSCTRRGWLACAVALGVPAAACAQAPGAQQPARPDDLATQWRALRPRRGHFDGAAFDAEIDRWQGRKHVLMQQLASHAYDERSTRAALLRLMGTPDAMWSAGQSDHARALREARWQGAPRGELLVYDWRGQRDRLVFALDEGRVVAAGWLFALEQ